MDCYEEELNRLCTRAYALDENATQESAVVRAVTALLKETLDEIGVLQHRVDQLESPNRYDY